MFFIAIATFFLVKTPHTQGKNLETNIFLPGASSDISVLSRFESDLGVKFDSCKWYEDWSDPFFVDIAKKFSNHGCIPEVTWQPQVSGAGVPYDNVIAGQYDAYLDGFIANVKKFNGPVRISLAPEMNSEWAPWGIGANGNTTESHKVFWQYVVNRFRSQGATNVSWIWSPNVRFYGDPCSYAQIYPGDSYVDFVGLDGYNWGATQSWSVWQSFSEVFGASYNELLRLTAKNILIMEIGSTEIGGDKAAWITQMFSDLRNRYPRIQGFTWFSINKETDWRIDSSQASKIAFINGANGTSTTSTSNSSANVSQSDIENKKGSKNYKLVPVDSAEAEPSAAEKITSKESQYSNTVGTGLNDENGALLAAFTRSSDSGSFFANPWVEKTSLRLFVLLNALVVFLVLITNHRLHRKSCRMVRH